MRGCVYKLSLSSGASGTDASTKYYRVERLRLDIQYNYALALKENRIYVDHTAVRSFADAAGDANNLNHAPANAAATPPQANYGGTGGRVTAEPTFNSEGEEINFYPGWGGFYFVSHGWLNIIWDTQYPIDAYYGCSAAGADGACTTAVAATDRDTCHASTPLFAAAADMQVARVAIADCDTIGLAHHTDSAVQGTAGARAAYEATYRAACDGFAPRAASWASAPSRRAWLTHHTFSVTWMWYILGNNHAWLFYLKGRPDRAIADAASMGHGQRWYA